MSALEVMMNTKKYRVWGLVLASGLFAVAGVAEPQHAAGSERPANTTGGRSQVYGNLEAQSLEDVSSPQAIKNVLKGSAGGSRVWRTLEHGEKVECLDCIPLVSELLYDSNTKNREIGAWWLRRRIFGVFGPGEVYSQIVDTLQNDTAEERRAYAADALGEFLSVAGVAPVAKAVVSDASPLVRVSAVRALQRLNTEGPGAELGQALGDESKEVRLAAVEASLRVHVFSSVDRLVALISDPEARVRRRVAESLGVLHAADAVMGLIVLTDAAREDDATVRAAAVSALGKIGDAGSRPAVQAALTDPDSFVRDAARIALRRL